MFGLLSCQSLQNEAGRPAVATIGALPFTAPAWHWPAQGTLVVDWTPDFAAADRVGQGAADVLVALGSSGEQELRWTGTHAGGNNDEAGLRWVDGAGALEVQTRHLAGDRLQIRIHWGGGPSRPHLQIDGYAKMLPALSRVPAGRVVLAAPGTYQRLELHPQRLETPQRWVTVGDSISMETYTPGPNIAWPRTFGDRLYRYDGSYILAEGVSGRRVAGWTDAELDLKVRDQLATDVIFLIGANDFSGGGGTTAAIFLADLEGRIARVLTYPSVDHVYVSTVSPIGTIGDIEEQRWLGNNAIREGLSGVSVCPGSGLPYLDADALLRDPNNISQLLDALHQDGVHPNSAGHVVLANGFADALGIAE